MSEFKGKVVIITGASSGIGHELPSAGVLKWAAHRVRENIFKLPVATVEGAKL